MSERQKRAFVYWSRDHVSLESGPGKGHRTPQGAPELLQKPCGKSPDTLLVGALQNDPYLALKLARGGDMSRKYSASTLLVYRLVAERPLVSAGDLVGMTNLAHKHPGRTISNALRRGKKARLLESASLGWNHQAVDRYVISAAGRERLAPMPEFSDCVWLDQWDLESLVKLGPFVEMAYSVLPKLCQTNLFGGGVFVPRRRPAVNTRSEDIESLVLEGSDWREARLVDLRWLPEGLESTEVALVRHPFSLVAVYENTHLGDGRLYLPVGWKGRYQRRQEVLDLRTRMGEILELRQGWYGISGSGLPRHCPGALFICSDMVSGVMARNAVADVIESEPGSSLRLGIVDLEGQVLQPLERPSNMWEGVKAPPPGGPFGEPELVLEDLKNGRDRMALSVGMERWRAFKALADNTGIRSDQVPLVLETSESKAGELIRPMVRQKLAVRLEGGHYLESRGRRILAGSERVSVQRVTRQLGTYTRKPRARRRRPRPGTSGAGTPGAYRRRQRRHNEGVVDLLVALKAQKEMVFPAKGRYIDHGSARIVPDAYLILPTGAPGSPWVLAAMEYELSARRPDKVREKAQPYMNLERSGRPMPVLFVTASEEAAREFVKLRQPNILATTIAKLEAGPQGRVLVVQRGGEAVVLPGCWWYWYEDGEAPTFDAPINLWAASRRYPHWEVPVDGRLRRVSQAGPDAEGVGDRETKVVMPGGYDWEALLNGLDEEEEA